MALKKDNVRRLAPIAVVMLLGAKPCGQAQHLNG